MKNNIKKAREQKGMTQKECSDYFDITLRAWQTYEQGISEPKNELLCKIADLFNVTTDYLLGRNEPDEPLNPYLHITNDEMERRLLEAYSELPEKLRKEFAHSLMNALANKYGSDAEDISMTVTTTAGELEDRKAADRAASEDAG